LVLASPTAIVAAIGQATKHGVIIKSGDALERMGKVDVVAFDKTGTLTQGCLSVSDVIPFGSDRTADELLMYTASAESLSEHPLGKAITAYARSQNISLLPVCDFKMIPGKGVSADVEGSNMLCGNAAYLSENGAYMPNEGVESLEMLRSQGKATIFVSENGKCIGLVALSDTLRESSKSMVSELKKLNTDTVLLTGDHKQTADYFAEQVGITDVYAELLPDQKVEKIQELQNEGRNVSMIGDGVNDAPALKTAFAGVAMGGMGSDIAVEAADIALMGDDLSKIPYIKRLSNATVRLIKTNIMIAMCINFAAILLSVIGVLTPVTGALWHNAGSVLVVLNAALLYDRKYT
jgi:heavy metal translocating P-type ATPase